MKILSPCEACKKRKTIIRKRKVVLPTGQTATSQMLMCGLCIRKLNNQLAKQA